MDRIDNYFVHMPSQFLFYKNIREDMLNYFDLKNLTEFEKRNLCSQLKLKLKKKFNIPDTLYNIKKFRFPIIFPIKQKKNYTNNKIPKLKDLILFKLNQGDNIVSYVIRPVLQYLVCNTKYNDTD